MNTSVLSVRDELSFGQFMELALYGDDGYYTRAVSIGGKGSDFYTAAQSPLFAQALANALTEQWDAWGQPTELQVVEYGGGQGELAAVLGPALVRLCSGTITYTLVDRSRRLQTFQANAVHDEDTRLHYHFGEPRTDVPTCVVANEVLDALPVERVRRVGDSWQQAYVKLDSQGHYQWMWQSADASIASLADQFLPIPDGTIGEVCPGLARFFARLTAGGPPVFALLIDYGIDREEWASGIRPQGTLRGYYQHQVTDVLDHVGAQDITADVNWDHVRNAAESAGFQFRFLESQGTYLMSHGIADACQTRLTALASSGLESVKQRLGWSGQLKQLVMPGGMGERFQVFGCEWNVT
ncbi:SAM-dependent methyltransferase [Alicyclobacillus sp. ALC3]|uniref:SAM-dependent methyltransferase n=1 Tax=Alicyclobacillus sp. ALC3 TaxID=2796143 RepID=UPI00237911AC|nr:SAM-dependent methyltransferase [Alicyclobacillus sp. ALC3]WDL97464.1 SAM-dependent methyltransferase [Alicyclobacillus sp. ALC3]